MNNLESITNQEESEKKSNENSFEVKEANGKTL